jgi:hypothetical protein
MPSAYKQSIHAGSSTIALVPSAFLIGAVPFNTQFIQFNVWDNAVYVQWLLNDGITYTANFEIDPNWQPIIIPFLARGFQIIDKVALLHGRYQIIGMG